MTILNSLFLSLLVIATLMYSTTSSSSRYFTAAVYEHARLEDKSPDTRLQTNLEWYKRAATLAAKQGADIILFPEYGISYPDLRKDLKMHLEMIPNPKEARINPCEEFALYSDRPILHTLSCMASRNRIVVVANMGGKERCHGQPDCHEDGDIHLNANVVFNKDGSLLSRYYKERLFFEAGMDLPTQKQDPIFETDFGKFAMFISFDIMWRKMTVTSRLPNIDAILFSAMWVDSFPFFVSTAWFQAWAMGNNATLLAANLQMPGYLAAGSGIFRGMDGAIASAFTTDGISKLIVAAIPKGNQRNLPSPKIFAIYKNYSKPWQEEDDGKDIPSMCSFSILGETNNSLTDYRCVNEDVSNYTLKKLDKTSDHIKACSKGMCCVLDYTASSMNESFYLGVYSGMHNSFNKYFWSEENCFLARCDDFNNTACSHFPTKSETVFHKIFLTANFKSKVAYPTLLSSGMRLVPTKHWTYEVKYNKPSIIFNKYSGIQLLVVGLKGRAYSKDPPYIR